MTGTAITIIGPLAELGGVRTHVYQLQTVLQDLGFEVFVTRGFRPSDILRYVLFKRPVAVVFNLSLYRNQIYKNLFAFCFIKPFLNKGILHLHGGDFSNYSMKNFFLNKILSIFLSSFERVFCLTDEQYTDALKLVLHNECVVRGGNYVQIPETLPSEKVKLPLRLLYVGRLHSDKGVSEVVQAIQGLPSNSVRFYIAGTGELEHELKALDDPRVVFLGKKIGLDKEELFRKAHVFVLYSRWPEGLPYALLEAASYGLALLATDVGAISRVLHSGENGIFVEPSNVEHLSKAIRMLVQSPEIVEAMGKASRSIAERDFSLSNLREVYGALLLGHE